MPGLHDTEKFKLVGFWCDIRFLKEIERARGRTARSQFIRDALVEKLGALDIAVPAEFVVAPDRAGKGGRRRTIYPELKLSRAALNDPVSSARTTAAAAAAGKQVAYKIRRSRKPSTV